MRRLALGLLLLLTAGEVGAACNVTCVSPTCLPVTVDFSTDLGNFDNVFSGFNAPIDTTPARPTTALVETSLVPFFWRNDQPSGLAADRGFTAPTDNGGIYVRSACKRFAQSAAMVSQSLSAADCNSLTTAVQPWDMTEPGGEGTEYRASLQADAAYEIANGRAATRWDCWNEPELSAIFKTTSGAFGINDHLHLAQTYAVCYDALRDTYTAQGQMANLKVGTPTFSTYPVTLLYFLFHTGSPGANYLTSTFPTLFSGAAFGSTGYIQYLHDNPSDARADWFGVHLFFNDQVMFWGDWTQLLVRQAILQEITHASTNYTDLISQWCANATCSTGLTVPIYATEYGGSPQLCGLGGCYYTTYGHAVVMLAELYEGALTSGGRACWVDSDGSQGCGNKNLDALLVPDGGNSPSGQRPLWWIYKYYADMAAGLRKRHPVSSTYQRVAGLASSVGSAHSALIGYTGATRNGQLTQTSFSNMRVGFAGLPTSCTALNANVVRFAAGITTAVPSPTTTVQSLSHGGPGWELVVPTFASEEALYVTINTSACP